MKKTLAILISTLLVLSLASCGAAEGAGDQDGFVINEESIKTGMPVYEGLKIYDEESAGFSFLYPEEDRITYSAADGVGVYKNGVAELPYLLVLRTESTTMTPEKYFKACDKQLTKAFKGVRSTKIHKTEVDGKTLYMTRYVCTNGGDANVVIERYVEIYDKFYIQYSAFSDTEGEMNTELYYAIKTLSTAKGAYTEGIATSLSPYSQEDTGLSVSLPDLFKVSELTIGYMATGHDTIMLTLLCSSDDYGNPIRNRDEFLQRAMSDSAFMAGYLGAESVTFGEGAVANINGHDYYAYPMTMETYDGYVARKYSGKIYLGDSPKGCVVACYAINDTNSDRDEIAKVCESSVATLKY